MANKKQIRQSMKVKRSKLSSETVKNKSDQIANKICKLEIFKSAKLVCLYSKIGNEVDTCKIAQIALDHNKQIAYPRTDTKNMTMEFYTVKDPKDLELVKSGSFSLLEPLAKPETKVIPDKDTLMIVPGLAFDQEFYRIGYGGGFYDKYLALHPSLATIGVCYEFQLIPSAYPDQYDQALESVMTPVSYLAYISLSDDC